MRKDYYGSLQNVKQVIGGTSIWFEANPDPKGHSPLSSVGVPNYACGSGYHYI
jgi:hypothetical protein